MPAPSHLPKVFRIRMEDAVKAIGEGDKLLEVLDTLQDEGSIRSYDFIVELKIDRDKALAVESYFLRSSFQPVTDIKKNKKQNNDY